MSSLPHKLRLLEPLRNVRVCVGGESFVAERAMRMGIEEQFRAGFEAGQKALNEELLRQRKDLLEIQNNVFRSIERALPELVAKCEKDLLLLAIEAARRVVQQTPISAELIEAVIKSGLAELQDTAEYQVRLNPEDHALLKQVQSPVLPGPASKVTFISDPALPRANCVINTRHGSVALDREEMFRKMTEAVLC